MTHVAVSEILQFRAHIENGMIVPDIKIMIPADHTYWVILKRETDVPQGDALAAIAALAQPLGPADLSRHFDTYTGRVLDDGATR